MAARVVPGWDPANVPAAVLRMEEAEERYMAEGDGDSEERMYVMLRAALAVDGDPTWLARRIDPEAFEDHPIERVRPIAALQWAARRKMAYDAADATVSALLVVEA